MNKTLIAAAVAATFIAAPSFGANMILNNVDLPGVGFNDPTPAAPVGGNAGTTVGEQRLIAYRKALQLWGETLKSDVTVVVQGAFAGYPFTCNAGGGTLAAAGSNQIFSDFANAPLAGHWYGGALANSIAGVDLAPGGLDPGLLAPPYADDIVAFFNGRVGQPDCIAGNGWYYGLDSNPGAGQVDFLDTFMHEVAHGLGFQNFANEGNGSTPGGLPDVYMANTLDLVSKKQWNAMSSAEIVAAAIKTGNQVWTGDRVSANAGIVLGPYEGVRTSGGFAADISFGTAAFGPAPDATNFNGQVVLATDGVAAPNGGTVSDGCEAITAPVAGKIALVDRGLCGFAIKTKNAQLAGATGVVIANTLGRTEFGMAGVDPTIVIPSIGISNANGDSIKAALPNVSIEYFIDASRLAGTTDGYVRLYAPGVYEPGSSISHFDTVAAPNLLMEPSITGTLRANENLDLTPALMVDIGWKLETLKVGTCETGVANALPSGELLSAKVDQCAAGAKNKGQFVACANEVTNAAKSAGFLTGAQHAAIATCTAR
jgi:hypothetical protein